MSKRAITSPPSPDVVYDTDEDGTKVIIRKFDIPLPAKQGKITLTERKLEKWKYQHDVPEGKIFTKRVHAELSAVASPQSGINLTSNVSSSSASNVLQTNIQNVQGVQTSVPTRKDIIVVPPKELPPKVLTPVPKPVCSDKITLNNLPENVIANTLKVFDSKLVNGRKVLYLKAVKDIGKVIGTPMRNGTEVMLTQNEVKKVNPPPLKCYPGAIPAPTVSPASIKPNEVKCYYSSRVAKNSKDGRIDELQEGTPISKDQPPVAQKLKFTSKEVNVKKEILQHIPVVCDDCDTPKKCEVQVTKPMPVIVPATVQHSSVQTLSLPSQNKTEVVPCTVLSGKTLTRIGSGILPSVAHNATANGREIVLLKTNSHILIDKSKPKVTLAENNISVVGMEFLNSVPSDNVLKIDNQCSIKESKLKFVPADSTTPTINGSTSMQQNNQSLSRQNQCSTEATFSKNDAILDKQHLDRAVIGNQKFSGTLTDPKIISNKEGKSPIQNIVIVNPPPNTASSNATIIPKTNMDEIMRRRKIALKFQQDMQRAKEMPRIARTVMLPARKVQIVDSSTQTSLFCMLEPGRMVEMFLNEDSNDSNITKQSDSQETHIGMKEKNLRLYERNTSFTMNDTNQLRTSTNCQTATNDEIGLPLSKRIRLEPSSESRTVNGMNESCNSIRNNDPCLTSISSIDFDDLIQPFESMGKENLESMNINNSARNCGISGYDIENNNNNNNSLPLACLQSTLNSNVNGIGTSSISNLNTHVDNQARIVQNKRIIMQKLVKDYRDSLIPDEDGNLPLHNAVMDRDIKQVMRQCLVLSAQKQSVDIKNKMKESALHLAVLCHDLEIVKVLLKFEAKPDIPDSEGNTALHMAIIWGNNIDILKILLARVKDSTTLNLPNDEGFSPLHLCALHNKCDEALLLVKKNADVNIRDRKSGRTPLFHAVENGNAEISQVLLDGGAHTNIANFSGQTALNASELTFVLDRLTRRIDSPKPSISYAVPCVCQDESQKDTSSNISFNKNISGSERTGIGILNSNNAIICDIDLLDVLRR